MSRVLGTRAAVVVLVLAVGVGAAARQQSPAGRWVTAWSTSQQTLGSTEVTNASVRMIARVTIPGDAVRIRLDHSYGTAPLVIGRAFVGQRVSGAALAGRSNLPVTFNGAGDVTISPGGTVTSDPVSMKVLARQDLAVSLYVPGAAVRPSQHTAALVTSYMSGAGAGDVAAAEGSEPFTGTTTSMFWLKGIDVRSPGAPGAIVAFGDSITDGSCSTLDGHDRWEDWVALRLNLPDRGGAGGGVGHRAVLNEGIGGNTVTRERLQPPPDSTPGLERLDRDVLSHHGVTDVVLFMGTNDIRRGAPASQVTAGMEEIVRRVKARRIRIIGATVIPRHNRPPSGDNTGWSPGKTGVRKEVNRWMRGGAPFDGVIDFDKVVGDPANPDLIFPPFNCDDIHPSPRGYYEMGSAVRLDLFTR
jgi:lysophospholipase L1-like esterase